MRVRLGKGGLANSAHPLAPTKSRHPTSAALRKLARQSRGWSCRTTNGARSSALSGCLRASDCRASSWIRCSLPPHQKQARVTREAALETDLNRHTRKVIRAWSLTFTLPRGFRWCLPSAEPVDHATNSAQTGDSRNHFSQSGVSLTSKLARSCSRSGLKSPQHSVSACMLASEVMNP